MSSEIKESVAKEVETSKKTDMAKFKSKVAEQRKKDLKMVKGMFKYHEVPGGTARFIFQKYGDIPHQKYEFEDGSIHTIPYMVAQHINEDCAYTVHEYYSNSDNKTQMRVGSKVQRASFVPLEFNEESGLSASNIITVERA